MHFHLRICGQIFTSRTIHDQGQSGPNWWHQCNAMLDFWREVLESIALCARNLWRRRPLNQWHALSRADGSPLVPTHSTSNAIIRVLHWTGVPIFTRLAATVLQLLTIVNIMISGGTYKQTHRHYRINNIFKYNIPEVSFQIYQSLLELPGHFPSQKNRPRKQS